MSEQWPTFRRLVRGFEVAPVIAELAANEPLWSLVNLRQAYPGTAHADTESIHLRAPTKLVNVLDVLDTADTG
ncbi:MAG: hypothetical protein ACRETS_13425, partial [Steroidobacteraceae bacterium]